MDELADLRLERLTAELSWIRRLAYALVRDADVADDVSHEAWLAASKHVPADRPLRPWLSQVVRNVVRMRSRSQTRRALREAAVPEAGAVPTAEELVDRVELQRALADAVLALAEPYRSTVLLHYFEGLTSAEIARRLDIPDGTVRRRLKVALDELRAAFAKRDRRGVLALAPLAATNSVAFTFGGLTMKKLIAGLALVVIIVLGSLWWTRRDRASASQQAAVPGAAATGTPHQTAATVPTKAPPWYAEPGVAGRRIAGHVVLGGKPVAGAIVRLGNVTSEVALQTGDELAQLVTNADGAFDFGVQPAALFVVSAESNETTPASLRIATADPKEKADALVLELTACASRLYGSIVDASGGGIARARLSVAGFGGVDAGMNGEYSLCVPMGDSRVRIVADGYGALDLPIHLVGALRHDFELVPEAALAGVVVDDTGAPMPYARVLALPQKVEQPHFLSGGATLADAGGHFRIANLAPGRFLLAASADGGYGTSSPKAAVAVAGGGSETRLVVVRHARITGRVMMNGQPVGGVRVFVPGPMLMARASFTKTDGSFSLEGVPFGPARIVAGTFDVVSPKQLVVDKPVHDNVVVEVSESASLAGRVLRRNQPVAGAVVQTSTGASTKSDSNGHYELRGLPPGELQITAQAFGTTNAFAPFKPVKIVAGTPTQYDIDLTGGAEVRGTVVDENGAFVPNVYVRLIDVNGDLGESMTDARGNFTCTSMLGGGDYRAAVFPSPGARVAFPPAGDKYPSIPVPNGNADVRDVKIAIKHERLSIAGRVIDDTGGPVADVHVEAIGSRFGGNPSMLPSVRADVSGAFVITDLARGNYTLHAHAADGSEIEVPDVPTGTTNVELRLVRPGSIEGQLVGFTTTPRVHARQLTAQLAIGNEAVVEGDHFTIPGLAPGKYVLEALAGDQSAGQSVVVKSGAVTKARLEGKGRGMVEGVILEFASTAPVKGMSCVAAQSMGGQAGDVPQGGGPTPANTTDERGAFRIPAPIGKARVMCFSADGSWSAAGGDADVTADVPGKVELRAVRVSPPPCDPGFVVKPLTLPLVIASVDPASAAKAAGLAAGDRLVTIDGTSVAGLLPSGAMTLARNHRAGTTITLGIERGGAVQTIKFPVAAASN